MKGKNSLYRVGSLYRGSLYRALTVIRPIFHLILPTTHIIRPIWLAGLIKRVLICLLHFSFLSIINKNCF